MASADAPSAPRSAPKKKGRGRPLLESPALLLWFLTADLILILVLLLAVQVSEPMLWWAHLAFFSSLCFGLFAADKALARSGKRRVSEANLLLASLIGGALGALFGMLTFRHKTKTAAFRFGVPVFVLIHIVVTAIVHTPSGAS